jgi:hypothetical protein
MGLFRKTDSTCIVNTMEGIYSVGNQVSDPRHKLYNPYTATTVGEIQVFCPNEAVRFEDLGYLQFLLERTREGVIVNYTNEDLQRRGRKIAY